MSAPRGVRPARLHGRPIYLRGAGAGRSLPGASLFPFFGSDQITRYLMLVRPASPDIVLIPWRPGLVRVPLFGAILLVLPPAALRDASVDDLEQARALWHYDPWWVLADDRFSGHFAVPPLKKTNTVELTAGAAWRFPRDLGRLLPADATAALPVHPSSIAPGWRLDPVWDRWVTRPVSSLGPRRRVDVEPEP